MKGSLPTTGALLVVRAGRDALVALATGLDTREEGIVDGAAALAAARAGAAAGVGAANLSTTGVHCR